MTMCSRGVDFLSFEHDEVILHDPVCMECGEAQVVCDRLLKIDSWNPDVIQLRIKVNRVTFLGSDVLGVVPPKSRLQCFHQWNIIDYHCPQWAIDEYCHSDKKDKTKSEKAINEANIQEAEYRTQLALGAIYTSLFGCESKSVDNHSGVRLVYYPGGY